MKVNAALALAIELFKFLTSIVLCAFWQKFSCAERAFFAKRANMSFFPQAPSVNNLLNFKMFPWSLHRAVRASFIIFGLLAFGIGQPLRGADPAPVERISTEGSQAYTMRYNNVAAGELIRYISKLSGRNFVYTESDLDFQVTYISDEPESVDTILNIFIEILRINKLDVHEDGETFLVTPSGAMAKTARVVGDQVAAERAEPGVITKVFQLKFANPNKIHQTLSNLAGDLTKIEEVAGTRRLIVVDSRGNVERIEALIAHIDTDESDVQLEIYNVRHLSIGALISMVQEIATPLVGAEKLTIIPNQMTNTLFIVASPIAMKKTLHILDLIDVRSEKEVSDLDLLLQDQAHPDFHLHKLQYHQGDEIVGALKQVGKVIGESDSNDSKLAYCIDTMQWIESTNSLLFSGNPTSIKKLKSLISLLDTPVKQVFIELLIIDTSISNNLTFGVDVGAILGNPKSNFAYSIGRQSTGSNLSSVMGAGSSTTSGGTVSTSPVQTPVSTSPLFGTGGSLGAGILGNRLIHKGQIFLSLGALTKALQKDGDTQIVMNPRIVTEDNSPCKFFTGQTVRVKLGAQQATGASNVISNTYTTQDIGSTISIQPQISGNKVVTLQIDQDYSTSASADSGDDDLKPISNSSTTTTRVHVPDKFFLIIGGQSQHSRGRSFTTIPCLGGIPFLGKIIGDTSNSDEKRNLLLFVRPHIIDSYQDARDLMARSQEELRSEFKLPKEVERELFKVLNRSQLPEDASTAEAS